MIVDSDIKLYEALKTKYENNIKLISHNGFTYYFSDNTEITLNYEYKNLEIMYPDYNDTVLNIISEIRDNFGYTSKYPKTNLLDKKYNKIIYLILDGLGVNILENNLKEDSFLRRHYVRSFHSIYPSTTAASTTSAKAGKSPYETGWTGWENYIAEINKNLILFMGIDYFSQEKTGINLQKYIPYNMYYSDMDIKGYCIEPDFSNKERKIDDVLNRSLKLLKTSKYQIQYVYDEEPDEIMHHKGAYSSEAKDILAIYDKKIENYANKLDDDTLLIISADHGHTDVLPINLYANDLLLNMLNRKPANDARCITFSVKEDKRIEFEELFNNLYSHIYKLYKSEDAIALGFFGAKSDIRNNRIDDFLADYVAVGISNYYFKYKNEDFVFKSHHAGITRDEIEVPVIII